MKFNNLTDKQNFEIEDADDAVIASRNDWEDRIDPKSVETLIDIIKSLDSELTVWKTITKNHDCVTPHELDEKLKLVRELYA